MPDGYVFLCDIAGCPSCDMVNQVNHHGLCTKLANERIFSQDGMCQSQIDNKPVKQRKHTIVKQTEEHYCPACTTEDPMIQLGDNRYQCLFCGQTIVIEECVR